MRKRSSKRQTQRKVDVVLQYLRAGHTIPYACKLVGLDPSVIYKRMERSPKFAREVEKAETEAIDLALQNIQSALQKGDLKASMWFLERRCPELWGKQGESNKPRDIRVRFTVGGGDNQ